MTTDSLTGDFPYGCTPTSRRETEGPVSRRGPGLVCKAFTGALETWRAWPICLDDVDLRDGRTLRLTQVTSPNGGMGEC
jgi:hypothetical protein